MPRFIRTSLTLRHGTPSPHSRPTPSGSIVALFSAIFIFSLLFFASSVSAQSSGSVLARFITDVAPADLVEGADAFGPIREDLPVAPVIRDGERIAWAFIASDFVGTTGYSGKPIHTMVAVDDDAVVRGVTLVKHSEPIVLIGIPDSKIQALAEDYAGLDLVAEASSGGTAHDLRIIAGATVTIMVIDDSIVRAGLKVARHLGLGGLAAPDAPSGPQVELDPEATAPSDWMTLEGDGTLHRLSLDVGQVNAAFEGVDDPRAAERPIKDAPEAILGNLYGVDIHGADDSVVRNNMIRGRQDRRMNGRGNGIYVWNAPGAQVIGNDIRYGRDGIFVNTSKRNTFSGNLFRDLRFAVHQMYANDSEVSGNVSIGNHLGYALMFSSRLKVLDNLSLNDRDHGLMLNYTNSSDVSGNLVSGGAEKCTFIYNAHRNLVVENRFEGCDIGIHLTAGSERNALTGNAFVGNRTQVKYVGTTDVEWSFEGRGNYWSDHPAFDLDGDGLADSPFRPNDLMDHILWSQPAAALLTGTPAVQLIR